MQIVDGSVDKQCKHVHDQLERYGHGLNSPRQRKLFTSITTTATETKRIQKTKMFDVCLMTHRSKQMTIGMS